MLWIVVDGLDRGSLVELEAARAAAGEGPTTLGRLERRGLSFERAYAAASWSGASLASALTAALPSTHGVRDASDRLRDEALLLPEALSAAGLQAGAVVSDFRLGTARGFGRGWTFFDCDPALVRGEPSAPWVTRGALAFLAETTSADAPFLLLAHFSDARPPFLVHDRARLPERAPEVLASGVDALMPEGASLELLQVMSAEPSAEERAFLEAMRREELLATDRAIGQLIDSLPRLGLDGSTWIVISGGHGTELFEHGWAGDGHGAFEELLHVPWIVVPPGPRRAPRRIETAVSLASLAPTLADLLDVPFDGGVFPSLEAVLRGEELHGEGFAPFEVDHELDSAPPRSPVVHLRGAVSGEWKWIEDLTLGRGRLVHPASDPGESRDRSAEEPLRAQQLAARLERARRPAVP